MTRPKKSTGAAFPMMSGFKTSHSRFKWHGIKKIER